MSSMTTKYIVSIVGLGVLAGCATTPEQDAARAAEAARIDAEIAARRGGAVSQVCPRGSDGWRALGDDILLLEARGDWYMLELAGTCDPEGAFAGIVTRSRGGSSCLSRGDDIFTGRPREGGRCTITAIHAWDAEPEAAPSDTASGAEPEGESDAIP